MTRTARTATKSRPARAARPAALTARALESTVALTPDGRRLLEERLRMIDDVSLPLLRPLIAAPDRDERDVAEFERLLGEVDRLSSVLARADDVPAHGDGVVGWGSRVLIRLPDGEQVRVRPVHPVEAFLDEERVSVASPVSRAILGARAGQVVSVDGPGGRWNCRVVAIDDADPEVRDA